MTETEDLATHVSLCELRYKALEHRLDVLEQRLGKLEDKVATLQKEVATGFSDIKLLIEKQNNQKHTQLIATVGTVTVGLLGLLGYILTK